MRQWFYPGRYLGDFQPSRHCEARSNPTTVGGEINLYDSDRIKIASCLAKTIYLLILNLLHHFKMLNTSFFKLFPFRDKTEFGI
ncbi:hypothetical protein EV200_108168 [Pedobacter psychrotolerans]|uniref:Uncharacterized protein n=1 Tax=Pedobacter psychrotolerans TaxID=1843235 RepID=A0A4R2H5B6_9SPHI|nr:hypothetical protein EV200_108168 [Pedobacter psychrotolerans]